MILYLNLLILDLLFKNTNFNFRTLTLLSIINILKLLKIKSAIIL